jgi:hypothetical protein
MSEKTQKTNKENQTARNNVGRIVHAVEMVNSLEKYLDTFIDNPFFITCNNNIVKFGVELKKPIMLPYNISKIVFGDIVAIKSLFVRCSAIELWYSYHDNTDRVYTVELNDTEIKVKDLFMLLYVMDKMDSEDLEVFTGTLNIIQDSIETERSAIHDLLQGNGIETHG